MDRKLHSRAWDLAATAHLGQTIPGSGLPYSLRRIRTQPAEIWMVEMADRIANLRPPPSHWSTEKIVAYRQEAIRIHEALHAANAYLSNELSQAIEAYGAHGGGTTNLERAP